MTALAYLIETQNSNGRPLLVLGADAETLSQEIAPLIGEQTVQLIDCRKNMPNWHALSQLLEDISRDNGIAHFALGPDINQSLSDGLISIICNGRMPWPINDKRSVRIVLSTTAESLSELVVDKHIAELLREELLLAHKGDHNSPFVAPSFRQAIIFFHGIGNQTATNSIETFADAVLPVQHGVIDKYDSLPDSTYLQLRRLIASTQSDSLPGDQGTHTPRDTHIYEYYWADKLQGTRLSDSFIWLWKLLTRLPTRNLIPIWIFSWTLVLIAITTSYLWVSAPPGFYLSSGTLPRFMIALTSNALAFALSWFLIHYIGDAARYLSPTARNYECRENILKDGVERLQRITQTGDYDRIIVVGHSLGSVVAYDVLARLWERDFYKSQLDSGPVHSSSRWLGQAALANFVASADNLMKQPEVKTDENLDSYQEAQVKLWHEIRNQGNPWLITDLITLGSPLTYAHFLFGNNVERKMRQGTLPTCPPRNTEIDSNFGNATLVNLLTFEKDEFGQSDVRREILKPHAFFAFTRWTNLYFPARFGIFGDFVGGPLNPLFGRGIRDLPVSARSFLRRFSPLAHVSYWAEQQSKQDEARTSTLAIDALVKTLDLNAERVGIPRTERIGVPDNLLFRWRAEKDERKEYQSRKQK